MINIITDYMFNSSKVNMYSNFICANFTRKMFNKKDQSRAKVLLHIEQRMPSSYPECNKVDVLHSGKQCCPECNKYYTPGSYKHCRRSSGLFSLALTRPFWLKHIFIYLRNKSKQSAYSIVPFAIGTLDVACWASTNIEKFLGKKK